ncbi:MAG TPA: glycosyltransferase family 2 protein [Candidatus Saccharimonadales bacterium]|nr:glycosyltransferase family 2 protein [Candidatus Saccharimonadales bacterium]
MSQSLRQLLSVVIPVYNEQTGIQDFHISLMKQLERISAYTFEVIYCDDGSTDNSQKELRDIARGTPGVRIIRLSRNFGKELATTAGIHEAKGAAVITIDGDGQHPVKKLPDFIEKWQAGHKVVIGLPGDRQAGFVKKAGSKLFYSLFNMFTRLQVVPGATDYRLIDKTVRADFMRLTEHNRITRGLIDWLGYDRAYVSYTEKPRLHDTAGYSFKKLSKLAVDSIISSSTSPLYVTACVGAVILPLSTLLGLAMAANGLLGDPLGWDVTGGAYVSVLILFLIGILMMSQGIIGLYLSHIHSETQNRPLYIVDREASMRL